MDSSHSSCARRSVRCRPLDICDPCTLCIVLISVRRLRICRILLEHGADARMETRDKEVLFHRKTLNFSSHQVFHRQVALHHLWRPPSDSVDEYCHVLLAMSKQNSSLCHAVNANGETPLHKLCLKGDRPTVAAYLKCTAANINAVNSLGEVRARFPAKGLVHRCLCLLLCFFLLRFHSLLSFCLFVAVCSCSRRAVSHSLSPCRRRSSTR